mgnify:CR=1 FL=1|jgi:hypothetical protein
MNVKCHLAVILLFLTLAMSPLIASADWTEIHQNQSSSHIVTMTGDGYYMDPSNAYDGIGSQSGDPVILRTQTCFSGASPSSGTTIEIDYTLVTNQSSKPFHLIFNLAFIEDSEAPDGYASVAVYNENSMSFVEVVNSTSTGGADYNISRSSAYMDNGGNIIVKLKSGHSVQDCDASTETRVYEFDIYSDIQQQVITDTDGDGIEDGDDSCSTGDLVWSSNTSTDYDSDGCQDIGEDLDDDNDSSPDDVDNCSTGDLGWSSDTSTDYDSDGCQDIGEDLDDDNDSSPDDVDNCSTGDLGWSSDTSTDYDSDGCQDIGEDLDDDNDGVNDLMDVFQFNALEWADNDGDMIGDNADPDDDNDGYSDTDEEESGGDPLDNSILPADFDSDYRPDFLDTDDDNDGILDADDLCPIYLAKNWGLRQSESSYSHDVDKDLDSDGCRDMDEDLDDDNDNKDDGDDVACTRGGEMNWDSQDLSLDNDQDGCRDDSDEDLDDDNDGSEDQEEENCNTDPIDATDYPSDSDGDGLCDFMDPVDDSDLLNNTTNSSQENTTSNSSGDAGDIPEQGSDEASSEPKNCLSVITCSEKLEDFSEDPTIKAITTILPWFTALVTVVIVVVNYIRGKKHSLEIEDIEEELDQGDVYFTELGIDVKR